MAEGIVYLDVDDEITSAASRIRTAPGPKVALVVPYGSRIATSRMNFRLLSREAVVSNRRLSIVSGDAAVRSVAASAGLPVFASVADYESSRSQPRDDPEAAATPTADEAAAAGAEVAGLAASATVAAMASAVAGSGATAGGPADAAATRGSVDRRPGSSTTAPPPRKSQRPKRPQPDGGPARGTESAASLGTTAATRLTADPFPDRVFEPGRPRLHGSPTSATGGRPIASGRIRGSLVALAGGVALALVVAAVGAYLVLPSATISVKPRQTPLSIALTVSADPLSTTVDAVRGVVPAVRLDVPVVASRTIPTTGTKVAETPATGSVTFTNYDPTSSNTIPAGSVVSTEGGIQFRTAAALTVARASFTPPTTTVPSEASVAVVAVKPGIEGNVPANAIRVVPAGESPLFLAVANRAPTSGGTHTATPQISKAEVDKAVATLQVDLASAFRDAVAAGAGAPAGTTLFPPTAVLGPVATDPDPATLVGQAIAQFSLGMHATGSVVAVDPRPVRTIAETRLSGTIQAGHRLVDGSVQIVVGDGTIGPDGQITFPVSGRARQIVILDPANLRSLVKGKSAAEATAALAPYGDASVNLWPSWVSTVTSVDARLTVALDDGSTGSVAPGGPDPSRTPSGQSPSGAAGAASPPPGSPAGGSSAP